MQSTREKWDPIRALSRHFFSPNPPTLWSQAGCGLPFPTRTVELHHEVELVIALGAGGVDVKPADARSHRSEVRIADIPFQRRSKRLL
jgi:2-keto-4-pentenoate hydratase/2-oxohepta-3-ene-1,7-dioic acid hydratase in catechol pathway